jgi:hypothetical protein
VFQSFFLYLGENMADFKQVVGQYEELNKVSHAAIEFT